MFLKKISTVLVGVMFMLSLAVTTSYAESGRYWRGDNGRHVGWYNGDRPRWRGRYRRNRGVRWYYTYDYPRVRYVRYRTYPRYYTTYYPAYYVEYPRYRVYPRSGVTVNFRW